MDELTITLDYPLRLGDIEHRDITLRRPKLGDLAKCQHLVGFEEQIKLISLVSGIGPLLIEKMDIVDLKKCGDFFDGINKPANPAE